MASDPTASQRKRMIEEHLRARGVEDPRVLAAVEAVPRHWFVPDDLQAQAYDDNPLPIGSGQTISQPFIVAAMSAALRLTGNERVLEIGTGSGYQTAILAHLAPQIVSLERFPELQAGAREILAALGLRNILLVEGDGSEGYVEYAPYQAILVTAAAPRLPPPLLHQLDPDGGRLVIPVGEVPEKQVLLRVIRHGKRWDIQRLGGVRFVPLVGRFGFAPDVEA